MGQPETQKISFNGSGLRIMSLKNHLLRKIDWLLGFDAVRNELASLYTHTGRPPVYPDFMLRMTLVAYLYGFRSERRLVDDAHLNLAYR